MSFCIRHRVVCKRGHSHELNAAVFDTRAQPGDWKCPREGCGKSVRVRTVVDSTHARYPRHSDGCACWKCCGKCKGFTCKCPNRTKCLRCGTRIPDKRIEGQTPIPVCQSCDDYVFGGNLGNSK